MHVPFRCTSTTLGNIDYGIPIVARKSTDYRTTTGSFHREIPDVASKFECRVKAKIKSKLKVLDVTVKDENAITETHRAYDWKFRQDAGKGDMTRASRAKNVQYVRDVQERVFKKPPPPKETPLSEMKDKYFRNGPCIFENREVWPPEPYAKCEIKALGRDEQPAIKPEEQGFWKWSDPYLTTNRSTHIPFSVNQQNGVARKNIITFYDIAKYPKVRGFGPREGTAIEPLVPRKKIPMTDKIPFKRHPSERRVYYPPKAVPNFGKSTEYRGNYKNQSFSDFSPLIFYNCIEFPESLSRSSAWQDLCPPGMYCTESCHIGTYWPVNSVIDYGLPKEYLPHKQCCAKFTDCSQ